MQTTIQEMEENQKQIISIILIACSIVIGFFFTMDQGYGYVEKKDILETTMKEVSDKKGILERLQEMVKNIENDTELQSDIERYGSTFREDTIFNSIFAPMSGISISNISLSKGGQTPNGLSLATVSFSFKAKDIYTLGGFLDYLTKSKNNGKSYIIKQLSFPLDTTKYEAVSASIQLGMYYFE